MLLPVAAKVSADWAAVGSFLLGFLGSFISVSLLVADNHLAEAWTTSGVLSVTQAIPLTSMPSVAAPSPANAHRPFHPSARRLPTPLRATGDPPAAFTYVSVDEGKRLLDRGTHKFLDIRSARAFADEHIRYPYRSIVCDPFSADRATFVARAKRFADPSTPVLVVSDDGGAEASTAAGWLQEAGYSQVLVVEGGFKAWRQKYTPSGRNVRPKEGPRASTEKPALKSGLNVGLAATSSEERLNAEDLAVKDLQPVVKMDD
eukprot:EG_transcript_20249